MEAKDTIMSDEQAKRYESYACLCDHDGCRQAQAEITWDKAIEVGKQLGIKEVVELVTSRLAKNCFIPLGLLLGEDWQAKLKDWNISA